MVTKGEREVLTLWEYVKYISLISLELDVTIDEVYKHRDEFAVLSNVRIFFLLFLMFFLLVMLLLKVFRYNRPPAFIYTFCF